MEKPQKSNDATKGYASITILTRDVFGYLFGGALFLFLLEMIFGIFRDYVISFGNTDGFLGNAVLFFATVAVSYPIGRFLCDIGQSTVNIIPWINKEKTKAKEEQEQIEKKPTAEAPTEQAQMKGKAKVEASTGRWQKWKQRWQKWKQRWQFPFPLDSFYPPVYREMANHNVLDDKLIVSGIMVTDTNAHITLGKVYKRWAMVKHPELFHTFVSRPNTMRLLSETMTGMFLALGIVTLLSLLGTSQVETPNKLPPANTAVHADSTVKQTLTTDSAAHRPAGVRQVVDSSGAGLNGPSTEPTEPNKQSVRLWMVIVAWLLFFASCRFTVSMRRWQIREEIITAVMLARRYPEIR